MTDIIALSMGKGVLRPFLELFEEVSRKNKGAVKPEVFNLIFSQPPLFTVNLELFDNGSNTA